MAELSLLFKIFAQSPVLKKKLSLSGRRTTPFLFVIFFFKVAEWFDVTLNFVAESVTLQFLIEWTYCRRRAGGV